MKKKLLKVFSAVMILGMFSATSVMAYSYSFGMMTENVARTGYEKKQGSTAFAGVHCSYLNYPSATIRYKVEKSGVGSVTNYASLRGTGDISISYGETVNEKDLLRLVGHNPASNGGITVSASGTWTP